MSTKRNKQIAMLDKFFDKKTFFPGDVIYVTTEKDELSDSFLLTKGSAKVELLHPELSSKSYYSQRLPGDFIGESFVVRRDSLKCRVTAETHCEVLCLTVEKVEQLMEQNPLLVVCMYQALAAQMASALHDTQCTVYDSLLDRLNDERIDQTVINARTAQQQIMSWSDDQLDVLIIEMAKTFREKLDELAAWEVRETKIGNIIDKKHKLNLVVEKVVQDIVGVKTQGPINQINTHIIEYASPVGVIFGVVPVTNPVPNSLFKILLAIKTRNALIVSYPRAAITLGSHTIALVQNVLEKQGAPTSLIQHVPLPSSKTHIRMFMSHKQVDLILATGGPDLVKSAYSSGNPAYGVGPGNVPVFVSRTADVVQAATDIIKGKSYDNGIVCGSESNLVVSYCVKDHFIQSLEKNGAAVLNEQESINACGRLFDVSTRKLKREYIGLSAEVLADMINISRPNPIKVLVISSYSKDMIWLSKEKMAPILSMYFVNDNEGIPLAKQMLLNEGAGHTAVIHSYDVNEIDQYAQEIPACRILVNTPATHGMLGESTALPTSFMLGSGTYGGNITTDAITWRNFVNIKRLAFDIEKSKTSKILNSNYFSLI